MSPHLTLHSVLQHVMVFSLALLNHLPRNIISYLEESTIVFYVFYDLGHRSGPPLAFLRTFRISQCDVMDITLSWNSGH